jgi:hypothetical protein
VIEFTRNFAVARTGPLAAWPRFPTIQKLFATRKIIAALRWKPCADWVKARGYRLIGTHRFGFNAFFVKHGVGEDFFPEVAASSCLSDPFSEKHPQDWAEVESMPWHKVK